MRRLLLLYACISSLAASAAIITERNDVYGNSGCLPPPAYTFVGSSSRPGIASQWIPYGTYTGGRGDTEYTRVTSNLMGVVASALGGAMERHSVIAGYSAYNCLMRPMALPSNGYWSDHGEYLASATNCSLRIADQLNGGVLLYEFSRYNNEDTYYYNIGDSIEIMLADEGYYGASGVASSYGSRVLDNLTGNVSPPISSSWSSTLPFNPADSNLWKNVWTTFAACTNDLHFFPMSEGRRLDYSYSRSWYFDLVYDVWGADIYQAYWDLVDAVGKIPLDYTVEDVLSVDTGWSTDDFVHWRNGTTRLDWRRLGIICQLERQMEITYTYGAEDTMPFRKVSGHHHKAYLAENVQVPTPSATRQGMTNVFSFASLGASFSLDNETFDTVTNELSWTYPTCRAPAPTVVGGAVIGNGYYDSIYLDEQTAKDWILACVAAIATNADMEAMLASYEPVDVRLLFSLIGPSAESYDMNITAHPIDEYANGFVIVPSNSVEVASASGMNLSAWTTLPFEDYYTEWPTLAWVGFNYDYLNFGIYSDSTADLRLDYIYQEIFDNENGTIVTPAITLQSVGSGAPTNWMWQTTGLSSGGRWERTFDGSEIVWKYYKPSGLDSEYAAVTIAYQTHPETNWTVSIFDYDEARYGYYGNIGVVGNGSGPLPRSMSVPSYTVTWHSSYYKEPSYAHGTSDDLKNEEFFYPVGQYEGDTNDFRTISFSMSKYARAAYTYSEGRESDIMEAFDGQAWDRVYSRTRHSLQMLLSATGDSSMSDSVDICDDSSFGWESSLPNRDRRFRLASWGDATSLNNDNINRYNLLNGLSEQCRSRCSALGGMNVDATDEFARIRQQEYGDYMNSLNRATVKGTYRISVATDAANNILLWLSATVQKSDVDGSIEVQGSVSGFIGREDSPDPGPLPIPIGSKSWQYEIENWGASSVTNDTYYTSVRVDGRQSPVIKTLWKFKNLRDPNL